MVLMVISYAKAIHVLWQSCNCRCTCSHSINDECKPAYLDHKVLSLDGVPDLGPAHLAVLVLDQRLHLRNNINILMLISIIDGENVRNEWSSVFLVSSLLQNPVASTDLRIYDLLMYACALSIRQITLTYKEPTLT